MKKIILSVLALFLFGNYNSVEIRPNIIWLVAEDQSVNFFPMYGDETIDLPNLSSLREDGILYENAYSPVPVCAPARSSIITGMYPTSLGTHNMRTYAEFPQPKPSKDIINYSPVPISNVKMFTEYLRKNNYYTSNYGKEDYNFKKTDGSWDYTCTGGSCSQKLEPLWRERKKDQPFFAVFNFGITHESQVWSQGDKELYVNPDEINVPPIFPDTAEVRKDLAVNYSNLIRLDKQIGEIIDLLKKDNLYNNSVIFFYADHGGPFPRFKRALYETGIKVPLIIKLSKNLDYDTSNSSLVSFIDYAPTVLSLAGIKPPEYMQGKALLGKYKSKEKSEFIFSSSDRFDEHVDRSRAVIHRGFKYIKHFNPEISRTNNAYRDNMAMMKNMKKLWDEGKLGKDQAHWFKNPKPLEEMYLLDEDPYELNNIVNDPKYANKVKFMQESLNEWIIKTNDLGEFNEVDLINKFLVDGSQPKLSPLNVDYKDGLVFLRHDDNDITIVWRKIGEQRWEIYSSGLNTQNNIEAKAVQIGYEDSEITKILF